MFDEVVTQDEMKFLRLLLKCDANISQEQKHLKTKLARKDFTDYVEVNTFISNVIGYCSFATNAFYSRK
jgi:hypothetical protein